MEGEGVPKILGSALPPVSKPPGCLWQSAEDTGGARFHEEDGACFRVTNTASSLFLSRARNS